MIISHANAVLFYILYLNQARICKQALLAYKMSKGCIFFCEEPLFLPCTLLERSQLCGQCVPNSNLCEL